MHIRPLDTRERQGMAAEREWINDLLSGVGSDVKLTGTTADIPTIHTLLERGPFTEDAAGELALLGGAFGDVIAREIGMSWVVIEDDAGTEFALQYGLHSIFLFPRDMIVKRIERGERADEINLEFMLTQLAEAVQDQVRSNGI